MQLQTGRDGNGFANQLRTLGNDHLRSEKGLQLWMVVG
jgi:hypothetical protein